MAGETFAYFLVEDPNTGPLPLPVVTTDRIAVVRGAAPAETTYWASALQLFQPQTIPEIFTPASGDTVTIAGQGPVFINNPATLAVLTILLPQTLGVGWSSDICFLSPVTALTVLDASGGPVPTAPTTAFGPGAALEFKYVTGVWVYWK